MGSEQSELGQGRPQDWPDEMYDLATKIKGRLDEARSDGRPVVLSRRVAMDVVVGLNVGGDAIARSVRRLPNCSRCSRTMNPVREDGELVGHVCPKGHESKEATDG